MNPINATHFNQLIALVRAGKLRLTDVLHTTSKPVPVYCVIKAYYSSNWVCHERTP
ncbi:hypothetical protein NVP1023O_09 [Vibrio phage 1.023.O._10N.222.51.B4]|nr:hypothetical protein NVP1023O_09 [Vibrio phage 1.023.O._10N.222.51.B4]